mmetsp:Transcript_54285/g.126874  ORF Transcript_54285/g.126874 Transcript_54285/m.126874 type:complete len:374 (-) Transcript_54285:84-1205(-)
MQIFVAGLSTKAIQLKENSIQELKTKVQQHFGVPTDQQILQVGGKLLQPEATFKQYQIQDFMTVHLSMRLRGGRGELEVADVDCLPVELLDVSQLPPPTMEREMSHGTAAAHDFCIPSEDTHTADESMDKDQDYYDDSSKPPDFERGDSVLNAIDADGPSCSSPTQQSEQTHQSEQPSAVPVPTPPKAASMPTPPGRGVKRPFDQTQPPLNYNMPIRPGFPGHLPMGFQGGPFGHSQRLPFFPASVPHPSLVHKRPKGLAYDLDLVDDKLKKRLLKNRQSAERSRQKKNAMMKGLEEQLQDSKDECEAMRKENELLRAQLAAHNVALPEGVAAEPLPRASTPSADRVDFKPVAEESGEGLEESGGSQSCDSDA